MSKFNKLFNDIITQMNINLAECPPDTMLNQDLLDAKKIPIQKKAKVNVKTDGNTTGVTYTVDSDNSAKMMVDNIKANGGDATAEVSSGVTNNQTIQKTEGQKFAQEFNSIPFNKQQYNKFLEEGKLLGIDAVTKYLQEHSAQVSDEFDFSEAPIQEYFVEYALIKYNNQQELPQI